MANQKATLNHHAGAVLAYHNNPEKGLVFVLEQKDPDFRPPFFDNGLCFLGGNWQRGVHKDSSPRETMSREVREEFWEIYEAPESLNSILGQEFLTREPDIVARYSEREIQRIREVGRILINGTTYAADYVLSFFPPLFKAALTCGCTIFTKPLSGEELMTIEGVVQEFDGRLTTDNLKYKSSTVVVSLREINLRNIKFAYQYDHVLNDLLDHELSSMTEQRIVRTLSPHLTKVQRFTYPKGFQVKDPSNGPTYDELQSAGLEYLQR